MHIFFRLSVVLLFGAIAAGCASGRGPRFAVDESQLNWLEIAYRPSDPAMEPCQLKLLGTGSISLRKGISPQLADSFSTDVAHPGWNDVSTFVASIPPSEMRQVFQSFLDAGALDSPRSDRKEGVLPGRAFVVLTSKFKAGRSYRRATADAKLVGMVERLVRWVEMQEME
ncbi:MAG: hypothetical protein ACOX5G_02970 [Kiritimatiellia bacterium]|jgi:hypothetical protein